METLKNKEERLNQLYADIYSEEEAVDNFIYLTHSSRSVRTTEGNIRRKFNDHELGSLLRKLDPIAFNCSE